MFRKIIQEEISRAVPPDTSFSVVTPEQKEHGDYACSVALVLAKKEKKNPKDVAEEIVGRLRAGKLSQYVEKIEVAPPGFLNFFLKDDALKDALLTIPRDLSAWGSGAEGKGKTVVVEYFQLNIAKRPHIGHLRSAVIGDAIKRMLLAQGYTAVSDTHVGDWGTQFGILLLECKERNLSLGYFHNMPDSFSELENLYIAGNARIEKNPDLRARAKEEFAKLERGDKENRELWELIVRVSMENLTKSAERLELLPFDEHKGESSYELTMSRIVAEARSVGILKTLEDGARVVDLTDENLDQAVLTKSDGATTYLLRDLATIEYRQSKYNFWKNLYVVDSRQKHFFEQLFKVAERLGWEHVERSRHIEFGFMKLPDGALSSRTGNAISLFAVIDEAENRARKIIEEKNPTLSDQERVVRAVALGALKYFDLSHHRESNIVFDWGAALSFEGNAGPYLQYTYARLKSILRKAGEYNPKIKKSMFDTQERALASAVLGFPEAIEDALVNYTPHTLANYLYDVSRLANEFYHSRPVLQESDESKKNLRLALVVAVVATLSRGLYLLGIEALEEM